MRCVVPCAALAMAVMPSLAGAQSLSLSEADVLSRLSAESPRVRAIRAGIDIARADVLFAGRWPNPRFIEDREAVAGVIEYLTMVAQPLPITGRRGLEVEAATALVDAASLRSNDALRRARADLRLAYAQLVAAQIRERTLAASRDRLRELADILSKREAAGDAAGFDRLRAEREVSDVEADLGVAASERARAQAAVVAFFAAPAPSQVVATGGPRGAGAAVPEIDALLESAISARGDLGALEKEADAARFAARAADRRRIPEPEIIAGTKSSTFEGGGIGSVFTVTVPMPLFDRGKPERALAEARASQARAQADLFRMTLRADLEALRATVIERRQTAVRYQLSAVAGTDEIERVARVSYDAGERGILELLDAYRTGSTARVRQASLDLAVRQAEIELEFLSGWEMP